MKTRRRRLRLAASRLCRLAPASGRGRPDSPARASALALALLAITLNFLQPLVHAAAMRDGAPRSLWALCYAAGDPDRSGDRGGKSASIVDHECCLGLAHAQIGSPPAPAFTLMAPLTTEIHRPHRLDRPVTPRIRAGPNQPRAPPLSLV